MSVTPVTSSRSVSKLIKMLSFMETIHHHNMLFSLFKELREKNSMHFKILLILFFLAGHIQVLKAYLHVIILVG